jgi:regulator of sigma D
LATSDIVLEEKGNLKQLDEKLEIRNVLEDTL